MTATEAFQIARQYYATGQTLPAQQMFRYALELDPRHAGALHSLGQLTYLNGNMQEAVALLRQAAELEPTNADFWNDLAVGCCKAEQFPEAVAACEEALRLRPDFPEAYNNLGYALIYQKQHERAATVLEEAIRLRPELADAYGNLGVALRALDRPEEAAEALAKAVQLNPQNADAANMAGMILQHAGKLDRAMDYYRHALRVQPGYADPLSNLATVFKERGQFEEAASYYRQVLQIQPDHVLAYYNLSELASDGRYQFSEQELLKLRALFSEQHPSALFRSVAGIALASVLDFQGKYDEAFQVLHEANELRRQWLEANDRAFDRNQHREFIDDIIATFDRNYFKRSKELGTDSEQPIFILGMPRSGTTLVEHILASHPAVYGAGELGEFPRIMAQLTRTFGSTLLSRPVPFPNAEVAGDVAARYLRSLARLAGDARHVTIKLPENFIYLGLLATLFPRSRVIHCRRDPRDVCLSCYFHNFQGMDYSWSLEDLAFYYRQYERLMAHWSDVLPIPIFEVRYEDLIANQQSVTRDLLAHCELPWDERCLKFHENRRAVQTASTVQVRKPLSRKRIGRWKSYRAHLTPLLEALEDEKISRGELSAYDLSAR